MNASAWDNRRMANELRQQEEQTAAGKAFIRQFGEGEPNEIGSHRPKLLRDVAIASIKNPKIKELLEKHGYYVSTSAPAADSLSDHRVRR
jgi:hypothetical protein